jgi:hypothetical protein
MMMAKWFDGKFYDPLDEGMPEVCPTCKTGWVEGDRGYCECYPPETEPSNPIQAALRLAEGEKE